MKGSKHKRRRAEQYLFLLRLRLEKLRVSCQRRPLEAARTFRKG